MAKRDERDPARGSGPWIMDRWIKGHDAAGRRKPKWNRPYMGVMLKPDVAALEAKGDKLYAYGECIAERTPTGLSVQMAVSNQTVAAATRKLTKRCRLWDVGHIMVGPDGLPLSAGRILMAAVVDRANVSIGKTNRYSGSWVVRSLCDEIGVLRAYHGYGLDLTPLVEAVYSLKAAVSLGRMSYGWTDDICRECNTAIMRAQHAIEPFVEAAA
jgi:hypothetical protein